LCARLRTANIAGAAESVEDVARWVKQLRQAWPEVRIIVRGDSGFCRDELMAWCETKQVDYVLGLAKNERLAAVLSIAKEESRLAMNIRSARSFATLRMTAWKRSSAACKAARRWRYRARPIGNATRGVFREPPLDAVAGSYQ